MVDTGTNDANVIWDGTFADSDKSEKLDITEEVACDPTNDVLNNPKGNDSNG